MRRNMTNYPVSERFRELTGQDSGQQRQRVYLCVCNLEICFSEVWQDWSTDQTLLCLHNSAAHNFTRGLHEALFPRFVLITNWKRSQKKSDFWEELFGFNKLCKGLCWWSSKIAEIWGHRPLDPPYCFQNPHIQLPWASGTARCSPWGPRYNPAKNPLYSWRILSKNNVGFSF